MWEWGMILKHNRYIYILAIVTLVMNFVTNMGINTYYFTYIVGNVGLMGALSVVQIVIVPLMFVFPPMIRLLYSLIPLALYVVVFIAMGLYKVEKDMPQILKDNEEKRAAYLAEHPETENK